MPTAKDSYGKGYADGQKHASHEKRDGTLGALSDIAQGPLNYKPDGSTAYKGGFDEGLKDGRSKK